MANPLSLLFGTRTPIVESERQPDYQATALALSYDNANLKESMRDLQLYLEDLNWVPVDGWEEEKGFSIDTIKEYADHLRALLTVNPTIKKAVNARVGYIWGRGVSFEGTGLNKITDNIHNKEIIFAETAKWKLEAQLATDGNIWSARNKTTGDITQIPISQISGWVIDENDPSRVLYWLRRYTVKTKNYSGTPDTKFIEVFYPAYGTENPVSVIDNIKVDKNIDMIHIAANRQEGWILGIPDILAAMFWAKGHKELFESGTAFVKAQGRFASKVTSKSQAGAGRAAAAVAEGPRRDPNTGEILDIGGTAVMSAGLDMQLMGKMSGGVDFKAFDPVAGLIAVGLGVPLEVLLGRSDGDEKSLEQSTVDEMKLRQRLWTSYFEALFSPRKVKVIWPKIKTEPTYRQIQSLEIANKTASLTREEIRGLSLEAFGIEGDPSKIVDIENDNSYYLIQKLVADNNAENAQETASLAADQQATTPDQGVDAGVGKLSTGKDSKASRDNKADPNTKNK
jgi:hypothetical protein